jgi:hypothetical protein
VHQKHPPPNVAFSNFFSPDFVSPEPLGCALDCGESLAVPCAWEFSHKDNPKVAISPNPVINKLAKLCIEAPIGVVVLRGILLLLGEIPFELLDHEYLIAIIHNSISQFNYGVIACVLR